jgi:hypothetical protein
MSYVIRTFAFCLLTLLLIVVPASFGGVRQQSPKKHFTIVGYYHSPGTCHPAEVRGVMIGAQPPEVLSAGVTVESFSPKEIAAIKLTWKVYSWDDGLKRRRGPCAAVTNATVFLSGTTPLIQVGPLAEKETCTITTGRPSLAGPTTKTVIIEQPIIAWDEVKSLTSDGTRNTFNDNYAVVIYVSEIHFVDGTIWEGDI